jgi:hypothetical protein
VPEGKEKEKVTQNVFSKKKLKISSILREIWASKCRRHFISQLDIVRKDLNHNIL